MVTSCPLGTSGFECSFVIYLIPAFLVLGALLFRKNVANDLLGQPFSIIGSSVISLICYYLVYGLFHSFKWSLISGIIGLIIGGFVLAFFLPDGESD